MSTKKLTTQEFIERSVILHKWKYDYSRVVYKNSQSKVEIICLEHGIFVQTPNSHLKGKGCPLCRGQKIANNNPRKLTTDVFIEKARKLYGNKYDYSITNCKGYRTKIKFICSIHGVVEQLPSNHLRYGCSRCTMGDNFKFTKEDFLDKAKKVHNSKYQYELDNFENMGKNIIIICPLHGKFHQQPYVHLKGVGCQKCGIDDIRRTVEEFIKESKLVHGEKYDYSLVDYKNCDTKVKIICSVHGIFEQKPRNHINAKSGCPKCRESKGEKKIRVFLESNSIEYDKNKRFDDCVNPISNNKLSFDFYITKNNLIIEYDGMHHYKEIKYLKGDSLEERKYRDELKNKYCIIKNIKLIRIPYWEYDNIEKILECEIFVS